MVEAFVAKEGKDRSLTRVKQAAIRKHNDDWSQSDNNCKARIGTKIDKGKTLELSAGFIVSVLDAEARNTSIPSPNESAVDTGKLS